MVDISKSHRIEVHNTEDILSFKEKIFYPASEWNYSIQRNMQEIIPGLFLGPYSSALEHCKSHLVEHGITHIICVRDISEAHFVCPRLEEWLTYLKLDIADCVTENILRFFPRVNEFINDAFKRKGKVLVHGNTGISRSATLVVAYVMETFNLSNMEALTLVKEKRGCINPNDGFAAQLYEYEVIYKTDKFFATKGGSSKLIHTLKRKHVELEIPHLKFDQVTPSPFLVSSRNGTNSSIKKLPNAVSNISLKRKS